MLTLHLLISIATLEGKFTIWAEKDVKAEERKCIFLIFLLGTTIQDDSIRKRKMSLTCISMLTLTPGFNIKNRK